MKFYAEPNFLALFSKVNARTMKSRGFRFDAKGEYKTEDKRLIAVLKKRFSTIPLDAERALKAKVAREKELKECIDVIESKLTVLRKEQKEVKNRAIYLEVEIENDEISLEELQNELIYITENEVEEKGSEIVESKSIKSRN